MLTSIFKVINGLRYFGVGAKVTRDIYKFPETYWIVTRVKLSKDQDHGKVFGRLVWRGRFQPKIVRIGAPLKRQWSLVGVPDYKKFSGSEDDVRSLMPPIENIVKERVLPEHRRPENRRKVKQAEKKLKNLEKIFFKPESIVVGKKPSL